MFQFSGLALYTYESVTEEYLGLEGGPPIFKQDYSCPALLKKNIKHYFYGTITLCGKCFQTFQIILTFLLAYSIFARHY